MQSRGSLKSEVIEGRRQRGSGIKHGCKKEMSKQDAVGEGGSKQLPANRLGEVREG